MLYMMICSLSQCYLAIPFFLSFFLILSYSFFLVILSSGPQPFLSHRPVACKIIFLQISTETAKNKMHKKQKVLKASL